MKTEPVIVDPSQASPKTSKAVAKDQNSASPSANPREYRPSIPDAEKGPHGETLRPSERETPIDS